MAQIVFGKRSGFDDPCFLRPSQEILSHGGASDYRIPTFFAFNSSNREIRKFRGHVEANLTTGPYEGPNVFNGDSDQFVSSCHIQYSLRGWCNIQFLDRKPIDSLLQESHEGLILKSP